MPDEIEVKACKACFKEKPLSEFYYRKDTDSYKNVCKRCNIYGNKIKDQDAKICNHCGVAKPISEFQKAGGGKWLQPYCKPCDAKRKKKHYDDNKEAFVLKRKQYYQNNKEIISEKYKAKRSATKVEKQPRVYNRMSEQERKRRKMLCDKAYRQKNADKVRNKKLEYKQSGRALFVAKEWQRRQSTKIEFVTKKRLRGRIYMALKRGVKSESTMVLLGCTIEYFKEYFQSLFTEDMSWERYMNGEIVIDHIKPCVKFDLTDPAQQKICFHYSNMQPLWEIDNLKKGTHYNENQSECQKKQ